MEFFKRIFRPPTLDNSSEASVSAAVNVTEIEHNTEASPSEPEITIVVKESYPFAIGAVSDRGTHRSQNEDAFFYLQTALGSESDIAPFGLFIIADGLGGHEDGQVASDLAVREVVAYLLKTIYIPTVSGRGQNSESAPLNESFQRAIEIANRSVREGTNGGGSTLTAALLIGRTAYIAHIGDSRAYLISEGSVSQLTRDHSLGGRLMEIQGLSEEEVSHLPERHTLYKALGQPASPEPDILYHSVPAGSHLLLCSDGLWGSVSHQDILDAFQSSQNPHSICSRLANLAIAQGSDDNVSLIVLLSKER